MSFLPERAVALQIGPVAIHWYGVMYLLAFLVIWWILPRIAKHRGLYFGSDELSTLLFYGILGTLIGGRLGYVLFYGPEYYGANPLEILAIWKGGMSSHGGFIGVLIAGLLFCRKMKISFWALADLLVIPVAIGLAFGRLGNFINQELYGHVTLLPWGISVPGVEGFRHPTQLYAVMKDLLISLFCYAYLMRMQAEGTTFGVFLILYGLLRFFIELFRIETVPNLDLGFMELTRGQLLTIPIVLGGLWVMWRRGYSLKKWHCNLKS